jgi:hypothetical protein
MREADSGANNFITIVAIKLYQETFIYTYMRLLFPFVLCLGKEEKLR